MSGPTVALLLLVAAMLVSYGLIVFHVWRKSNAARRTSKTWRAFVVFNPIAVRYFPRRDEQRNPEERDEHYKDLFSGSSSDTVAPRRSCVYSRGFSSDSRGRLLDRARSRARQDLHSVR